MSKRHRPRRGSLAFSPRKRARSERCRIKREVLATGRKLQGFAGFKAGMTHLMMLDDNPFSSTKGMEIAVPATIIETPPLRAEGVRLYRVTNYGKLAVTEVWARSGPEAGGDFTPIEEAITRTPDLRQLSLHLIVSTRPNAVSGVPKKKHDLLEMKMRGEVQKDLEYAKELLGKELRIKDVLKEGEYVDITAVTKGKGTQGPVKRWGIMTLIAKSERSGRSRRVGAIGGWTPARVRWRVPQLGQTGYQQRTEYNKRILKIGERGEEVTPRGGFLNYGVVRNEYLVLKGSIPGPRKRLIRITPALRAHPKPVTPEILHISTRSQQGV